MRRKTPKDMLTGNGETTIVVDTGRIGLAEIIGRNIRKALGDFAYFAGFVAQVLVESLRFFRKRQAGYKVLVMQILFTGVEALGIVAVLSLALGSIIIIQGITLLPQFGQGQLMYNLLIIIITRELGPILTAFIIIARSGTAIATEIAGMVVSHEIEAYIASGINPISYLVVPRFIGGMMSMVILTVYFSVIGLMGGYVIASLFTSIPFTEYWSNLLVTLGVGDLVLSVTKALVFGAIVAIVSTFEGFAANRASTEVPQAGLRAVGKCFVACILADALISVVYYLYL